jgi:hypothetical protein
VYRYTVYGINVESDTALSLTAGGEPGASTVALVSADADYFTGAVGDVPLSEAGADWFKIAHLPDQSIYVRWEGWFQFLIAPDGRGVAHGRLGPVPEDSFQTYLLSQALSFALVKMGYEPFHVTSVEANGRAIGFMGPSGLGKSTLAACFLAAGCRLVTDDVLIVFPETGLAQPGPRRIKLFPGIAKRFLGPARASVPMNPDSEKIIVPLGPERCCARPIPMTTLYLLVNGDEPWGNSSPRVEQLSKQEAFVQLIGGTFNARVRGRDRLKRQFACLTRLAEMIPVERLTYPRELSRIAEVRDLVLADLAQ